MATVDGNDGSKNTSGGKKKSRKPQFTAVEDEILRNYVIQNGARNWNSVGKDSGLNRCGKSCRLRWKNHLRDGLKKAPFSAEEEATIVELHSLIGSKWATMRSKLPGRTDNEIKNFWNLRKKTRVRAGLPLYPEVEKTESTIIINNQCSSSLPSIYDILNSSSMQTHQSAPITSINQSSASLPSIYDLFKSSATITQQDIPQIPMTGGQMQDEYNRAEPVPGGQPSMSMPFYGDQLEMLSWEELLNLSNDSDNISGIPGQF